MTSLFGYVYASLYDALYEDKDYEGECDLFERLFTTFGAAPVHDVLDLGCGTGGHSIPLARRGYAVVGVDRSDGMLAVARAKAAPGPGAPTFAAGDIRTLNLNRTFDAAIMPFAVLGYQLSNDDVLSALRTARGQLRPGGLLVADVWHGPAVLMNRPAERVKRVSNGERSVVRSTSGTLDTSRHICTVDYRLRESQGDRVIHDIAETHVVRYFFPLEMQLFLESAGFTLERLSSFPDLDTPAGDATWNVLVVARAAQPQ